VGRPEVWALGRDWPAQRQLAAARADAARWHGLAPRLAYLATPMRATGRAHIRFIDRDPDSVVAAPVEPVTIKINKSTRPVSR
jgi:hypothetical protein